MPVKFDASYSCALLGVCAEESDQDRFVVAHVHFSFLSAPSLQGIPPSGTSGHRSQGEGPLFTEKADGRHMDEGTVNPLGGGSRSRSSPKCSRIGEFAVANPAERASAGRGNCPEAVPAEQAQGILGKMHTKPQEETRDAGEAATKGRR